MVFKFWLSCLYLPNSGITGIHSYALLMRYWGLNPQHCTLGEHPTNSAISQPHITMCFIEIAILMAMSKALQVGLDINIGHCYRSYHTLPIALLKHNGCQCGIYKKWKSEDNSRVVQTQRVRRIGVNGKAPCSGSEARYEPAVYRVLL